MKSFGADLDFQSTDFKKQDRVPTKKQKIKKTHSQVLKFCCWALDSDFIRTYAMLLCLILI